VTAAGTSELLKLASLGFPSLQHLPVEGVHWSGVCLAPYVALSGFDYPLSGFLLPIPLSHFPDSSVLGIFPFRVFLPLKSATSREVCCSHALGLAASGRRPQARPELQSFVPSKEPSSEVWYCTENRSNTLLGFCHL
jgi:hypothetical protein